MPVPAKFRIRGLSSLIHALNKVCKAVDIARVVVRPFVPDASLAAFDAAMAGIETACDAVRAIDYNDTSASTNAPWGSQ